MTPPLQFAQFTTARRGALLMEASARLGLTPDVLEKDYWVSWVLNQIYSDPECSRGLVFKGGSALAMAFDAIARFSEDVDLAVPPSVLGFADQELTAAMNPTRRNKLNNAVEQACVDYLINTFMPQLEHHLQAQLGARDDRAPWLVLDDGNARVPPSVLFRYPAAFSELALGQATSIKLELGAGFDQTPASRRHLRSLLGRALPELKAEASGSVLTLEIGRTFWEKAMILHSEFHRPAELPMPFRYARHYSDFANLWSHECRASASRDLELLARVREHQLTFFPRAWASHSTATPGSFHLLPPDSRLGALRQDYDRLRTMFMAPPMPFAVLIQQLQEAELDLNRVSER